MRIRDRLTAAQVLFRLAMSISVTLLCFLFPPLNIVLPFTAPMVALLLARPIIEGFARLYEFLHKRNLEPWQGAYYSFNGYQVRILQFAGEAWIVDQDIAMILGLSYTPELQRKLALSYGEDYQLIPDTSFHGFNEVGVMKFMKNKQTHHDAVRFKLWLERDVFMPMHPERSLVSRPDTLPPIM